MCYLVVKKFSEVGSIVIKQNDSKELSELSRFLRERFKNTDKQVITISDMEMWFEYGPFTIIENVSEFISKAESL